MTTIPTDTDSLSSSILSTMTSPTDSTPKSTSASTLSSSSSTFAGSMESIESYTSSLNQIEKYKKGSSNFPSSPLYHSDGNETQYSNCSSSQNFHSDPLRSSSSTSHELSHENFVSISGNGSSFKSNPSLLSSSSFPLSNSTAPRQPPSLSFPLSSTSHSTTYSSSISPSSSSSLYPNNNNNSLPNIENIKSTSRPHSLSISSKSKKSHRKKETKEIKLPPPPSNEPKHLFPILLGMMPYIMTSLFGFSETWLEISFILLILFWLYLSLKVPWDIYYSILRKANSFYSSVRYENQSKSRSGSPSATFESALKSPTLPVFPSSTPSSSGFDGIKLDGSANLLPLLYKCLELLSICLVFLSPFISVYGIMSFQLYYSQYQTIQFLAGFNIHLFLLAALIPSMKYFFGTRSPKRSRLRHTEDGGSTDRKSQLNDETFLKEEKPIWAKDLGGRLNRLERALKETHLANSCMPPLIQAAPCQYGTSPFSSSPRETIDYYGPSEESRINDHDRIYYQDLLERFSAIENNLKNSQTDVSLSRKFSILQLVWTLLWRSVWYMILFTTWPWWTSIRMSFKLTKKVICRIFFGS